MKLGGLVFFRQDQSILTSTKVGTGIANVIVAYSPSGIFPLPFDLWLGFPDLKELEFKILIWEGRCSWRLVPLTGDS